MPLPIALVIDDDAPARSLVVHALRERYDVQEAATVAAALEAVRQSPPDVVVLDLCLDREPGELHAALVRRGLPVVLVSGQEPRRLPAEAEARGWTYLTKPVDPPVLAAAVDAAYATREERMTPTIPPGTRPTAPTPPPPPPSATASPVPTAPTDPPHASEGTTDDAPAQPDTRPAAVQIRDLETRRQLRAFCALLVGGLTAYFESRGHTVPGLTVGCITGLGIGVPALRRAFEKRPVTTASGIVALVALAVTGDVAGSRAVSHLAAIGTGTLGLVDDAVRTLRG